MKKHFCFFYNKKHKNQFEADVINKLINIDCRGKFIIPINSMRKIITKKIIKKLQKIYI